MREVEILQAVTDLNKVSSIFRLYRQFAHHGPHGKHVCLVMDLLSTNVVDYQQASVDKVLPIPAIKVILNGLSESLVDLHALRIIHTGK